ALDLQLSTAQENKVVDKSFKAIPAPAIKHRDVTPHSLGVAVQDLGSRADLCSVILERQTPTPCTATKMYGSMKDEQTKFLVQILQGEDAQSLKECLVVAEKILDSPARSHTKPSIEATMSFDESAMVTVVVKD